MKSINSMCTELSLPLARKVDTLLILLIKFIFFLLWTTKGALCDNFFMWEKYMYNILNRSHGLMCLTTCMFMAV